VKILALDIETSPNLVYTWGLFDQNVGLNQIVEQGSVLCFAAKWVGKPGVFFHSVWGDGREEMLAQAHALLDEADVVMHYNGNRFDIPHLNREFVQEGLAPPSPFANIDLYSVVRRRFKFQSNRLENVAVQLGLKGKEETGGFDLWKNVMAGDEVAQRRMRKYNRRDVTVLEEMYEILRPWIPNHPSVAVRDGGTCPRCGSNHVQRRGFAYTQVSAFQQFQCQACRGWFRGTKRVDGVKVTAA
jgi:DNA polymerase elongation subunit (family B)